MKDWITGEKPQVTVTSGDTLSAIAREATTRLGKTITYQNLASWNGITNPKYIKIGQVIKCYDTSSDGPSSPSSAKLDPNIHTFGLSASKDNTLLAVWDWSKASKTSKYKIEWAYVDGTKTANNGSDVWFGKTDEINVDSDNYKNSNFSEYQIPSGAIQVRFRLKPIPIVDENGKPKFSNKNWTDYKYWTYGEIPNPPSDIDVEVDGSTITATVEYRDSETDIYQVEFAFVRNNDESTKSVSDKITLTSGVASYSFTGADDSEYKIQARVYAKRTINDKTSITASKWSDYTQNYRTKPIAPSRITTIRAESSSEVYLSWIKVETADSYKIEYTEDIRYFDKSNQVQSTSTEDNTSEIYINGLTTGKEYFFRVQAVRDNNESTWTEPQSIAIGMKPAAPTTWSSTSTVIEKDNVNLYWVHSARDGSRQSFAKLKLDDVPGHSESIIIDIGTTAIDNEYIKYTPKVVDKEENEPTYECVLKTGRYTQGAKIKWSVCTAGVKKDENNEPLYGPYSTPRNLDIYTAPVLMLNFDGIITTENGDTITGFPINIKATATPNTDVQSPIGYHFTIKAIDGYDTVDNLGNFKMVNAGDEVYSKYFNPDEFGEAVLSLLPSSVTLENGMRYTLECKASMTSGLSAESSRNFVVSWIFGEFQPDAIVSINNETYTAQIRPYCENRYIEYRVVEAFNIGNTYDADQLNKSQFKQIDGTYVEYRLADVEPLNFTYGEPYKRMVNYKKRQVKITTGENVLLGMDNDGNDLYFAEIEIVIPITDVKLSVYRRDFDGGFTEIASGLDGAKFTTVTDPHPALDYARYRVVAIDNKTGHVEYYDVPDVPVGGIAAVIQWDEQWKNFDMLDDEEPITPGLSGSMLILPYNIDVSDNSKPENTLVEYIGRSHPVAYYGTQLGMSSSWNTVIPKDDTETLYGLRRLATWLGNVYVREPSGSGYWANITVSFSQKHKDLTIPISISITRIEGGA